MKRNVKHTAITALIAALACCALAVGIAAAQDNAARSPAAPEGDKARLAFEGRLTKTKADVSPVK